ncbi:kelch repeat-containing protein [Saccharospirillum sp. HFRX-1]|uniref:Kelch repeat-containing protein n=1 Tax=unclassified Saccharospirillum TaxID=2633430 RepID=UPI003714411E
MNVLAISQLASQVSSGRFRLFIHWFVSVGLVAGLAACDSGSSSAPTNQGPGPVVDDLQLSVWVGPDKQAEDGSQQRNNQLTLTGSIVGHNTKLYTYSDPECLNRLDELCSKLEFPKTTPFSVENDDNISLTAPSYALLQTDGRDYVTELNAQRFPNTGSHQVVYFRDRSWLVGGYFSDGEHDLWSSTDGRTWVPHRSVNAGDVSETALFRGRNGHQVVVFDARDGEGEQLWLIGGSDRNDVWSSTDAVHWTLHPIQNDQRFSSRSRHQVVVFDSDQDGQPELWLLGGHSDSADWTFDDLWKSIDGVNWVQEKELKNTDPQNPKMLFYYRERHQLVVFDGDRDGDPEMWLIGGYYFVDGSGTFVNSEVWSSGNGIAWTRRNDLPVSARYFHQVAAFDAGDGKGVQLWLVGGQDKSGTRFNEVWSSSDGTGWTQHNNPAVPFSPVAEHQLLVADANHDDQNELWLIGGFGIGNQTWSTENGDDWVYQSPYADFSPQAWHQAVAFDSGDGERLWMVGHSAGKSEVWSSIDGVDWTRQTAVNSDPEEGLFTPREGHQLVVFTDPVDQQEKLWLIGGEDADEHKLNEVWSSPDGIQWTQRDCTANCFSARFGHQVVVFDEQLWLVGGEDDNGNYLNDVWSSSNGTDWSQKKANDSEPNMFSGRSFHQLVVFDGDDNVDGKEMWLIGGGSGQSKYRDVWFSSNGEDWELRHSQCPDDACFSGRSGLQVVAYDAKDGEGERLWLIAGDRKSDVWSSTNGVEWQKETDAAAFSGREGHQVVVYPTADNTSSQSQLLLIGGESNDGEDNQIWRSTDGKDWQLLLKNAFRPKP